MNIVEAAKSGKRFFLKRPFFGGISCDYIKEGSDARLSLTYEEITSNNWQVEEEEEKEKEIKITKSKLIDLFVQTEKELTKLHSTYGAGIFTGDILHDVIKKLELDND